MPCHVPDGQVGKIVEAIELGPRWLEEVLAIISLKDQVQKIREERSKVQEKLRRMAKAYMDGLFPDDEYHRQKRLLEMELEGLVVPEANAAEEAGKLVLDLPWLWAGANLTERHKLLLGMLDAIYVDARDEKRIVALKPKPAFRPVFQVATTREGSGVELLTSEPPEKSPEARPCFWWRRGRVRLGLKHGPTIVVATQNGYVCTISSWRAFRGISISSSTSSAPQSFIGRGRTPAVSRGR